jgi:hypothetical protein
VIPLPVWKLSAALSSLEIANTAPAGDRTHRLTAGGTHGRGDRERAEPCQEHSPAAILIVEPTVDKRAKLCGERMGGADPLSRCVGACSTDGCHGSTGHSAGPRY